MALQQDFVQQSQKLTESTVKQAQQDLKSATESETETTSVPKAVKETSSKAK